jgi:hypothetical protein
MHELKQQFLASVQAVTKAEEQKRHLEGTGQPLDRAGLQSSRLAFVMPTTASLSLDLPAAKVPQKPERSACYSREASATTSAPAKNTGDTVALPRTAEHCMFQPPSSDPTSCRAANVSNKGPNGLPKKRGAVAQGLSASESGSQQAASRDEVTQSSQATGSMGCMTTRLKTQMKELCMLERATAPSLAASAQAEKDRAGAEDPQLPGGKIKKRKVKPRRGAR